MISKLLLGIKLIYKVSVMSNEIFSQTTTNLDAVPKV